MREFVFDREYELGFVEACKRFLNSFLPCLIKELDLQAAIDVGCGVGHFTAYLADLGLKVIGFDIRAENVEEARKRCPQIQFLVHDVESDAIRGLGRLDLVLSFGILYHLENPLMAIRNLSFMTEKIMLIESMILSSRNTDAALVDEPQAENQSQQFLAWIPSEPSLVKMLYKSGFSYVYTPAKLPDHDEFRSAILCKKKRTFLAASKVPVSTFSEKGWLHLKEPVRPSVSLWQRRWL